VLFIDGQWCATRALSTRMEALRGLCSSVVWSWRCIWVRGLCVWCPCWPFSPLVSLVHWSVWFTATALVPMLPLDLDGGMSVGPGCLSVLEPSCEARKTCVADMDMRHVVCMEGTSPSVARSQCPLMRRVLAHPPSPPLPDGQPCKPFLSMKACSNLTAHPRACIAVKPRSDTP
jgi:hypothetical protein